MDVEDVLVALLARGAHEHPAAASRRDLAGDVGGGRVQIMPRRDLAVPEHFEFRNGHIGSKPRVVLERSACRELDSVARPSLPDAQANERPIGGEGPAGLESGEKRFAAEHSLRLHVDAVHPDGPAQ